MRRPLFVAALAILAATGCATASPPVTPATATTPASWIARSDANARVLVALEVEFAPERASTLGVEEADEKTVDLSEGFRGRHLAALRGARRELEARRAAETDPLVRGDLDILLRDADLQTREIELDEQMMVPTWDVARMIFNGVHALLDDQVAPGRRARAMARLKRYVGLVPVWCR